MSHNRYENSQKGCEAVREEMRGHLRIITNLWMQDSRKQAIAMAANALGMSPDRVRRIYYGQAYRIEAHEADRIRAYVGQAYDLIREKAAYERRRAEFVANARPSVARLVPPALETSPVSEAAPPKVRVRG